MVAPEIKIEGGLDIGGAGCAFPSTNTKDMK